MPLTIAQVDELISGGHSVSAMQALGEYLKALDDTEMESINALAETYDHEGLVEMINEVDRSKPGDSLSTRVAFLLRKATDASNTSFHSPYKLPVVSIVGTSVHHICEALRHGARFRLIRGSGWVVQGAMSGDVIYPTLNEVQRLSELELVVPAPGQRWDDPTELLLSAIGWRSLGHVFTDQTAAVELRVNEPSGTTRDNDIARRYRSITAGWRARQVRRDATPSWGRWCEFTVTIPDKVTEDGLKTVTVVLDSGKESGGPDLFEFFGEFDEDGSDLFELDGEYGKERYRQHRQSQGSCIGQTVTEVAYEITCGFYSKIAAHRLYLQARIPQPKKKRPPLRILDEGENAEYLAMMLGII